MADRYVVTLSEAERHELQALVSKGKAAARKLTHARILLQAGTGAGGPGWADGQIIAALMVGESTVLRVRRAFVEEGLTAALERKKATRYRARKLDGQGEAQLVKLACSQPPPGRARWTLGLLVEGLVELQVVDTVSDECVRQTLKKTSLCLGARSSG